MTVREDRRRNYPLTIPERLLQSEAMQRACAAQDFQEIFRLINRRAGISQADIAAAVGKMTSARVADVMHGRRRFRGAQVKERIADGLGIPGAMLSLPPRPWEATPALSGIVIPSDAQSGPAYPSPHIDSALIYSPSFPDTLSTVMELGSNDVRRRDFIRMASFSLGALSAPSRDWLIASLDAFDADNSGRIGVSQLDSIRKTFAMFQEMDVIGGGGDHVREALAQYLTSHVLPRLDQRNDEKVHTSLCQVASEQTYLLGWMAYDAGHHGFAQRYLIQSLRLSQESGDRVFGAHVLAGLSDQAGQLGHPQEALSLARTGQHGLRGIKAPSATTDLYVLEARAHASLGNEVECAAAISKAEAAFDAVNPENEPEWARFIDLGYVTGEIAMSLRDVRDGRNSEKFARQSIAACEQQQRKRRAAFSYSVLAATHVQQGDAEAAANAAQTAVELSNEVQSIRCTDALTTMRRHLAPCEDSPAVRSVVDALPVPAQLSA